VQSGGNGEGKDHNEEQQQSPPRVPAGARQSKPEKRVSARLPAAIFEKTALEVELEKDISCFNGYSCTCGKTYNPTELSIRLGTSMEIKEGQEGVVLNAKKIMTQGTASFWVQVKIVKCTPGLADYTDGATGWVPAWALQIGTFRKFGDIGYVFV